MPSPEDTNSGWRLGQSLAPNIISLLEKQSRALFVIFS
jgi:hypothetical protein